MAVTGESKLFLVSYLCVSLEYGMTGNGKNKKYSLFLQSTSGINPWLFHEFLLFTISTLYWAYISDADLGW